MRETDLFAYTWPLQALWDVSFGLQLQLQQSGIVALVHCHVCQPCVASLDIPDHLKQNYMLVLRQSHPARPGLLFSHECSIYRSKSPHLCLQAKVSLLLQPPYFVQIAMTSLESHFPTTQGVLQQLGQRLGHFLLFSSMHTNCSWKMRHFQKEKLTQVEPLAHYSSQEHERELSSCLFSKSHRNKSTPILNFPK